MDKTVDKVSPLSSGLSWHKLLRTLPCGRPLVHLPNMVMAALGAALRQKAMTATAARGLDTSSTLKALTLTFSCEEWDALGVSGVCTHHYVEVDGELYIPANGPSVDVLPLLWRKAGRVLPIAAVELVNDALAKALEQKSVFTSDEVKQMQLPEVLLAHHFVKVGSWYYRPATSAQTIESDISEFPPVGRALALSVQADFSLAEGLHVSGGPPPETTTNEEQADEDVPRHQADEDVPLFSLHLSGGLLSTAATLAKFASSSLYQVPRDAVVAKSDGSGQLAWVEGSRERDSFGFASLVSGTTLKHDAAREHPCFTTSGGDRMESAHRLQLHNSGAAFPVFVVTKHSSSLSISDALDGTMPLR